MGHNQRTVLLLGTFTKPLTSVNNYFTLTKNADLFDMNLKGALSAKLIADGPFEEERKVKIFHFSDLTLHQYVEKYDQIAVVNLGQPQVPAGIEKTNIKIDNIIEAIVSAIRFLKAKYFDSIYIDSCENPKIVGTAVSLTMPILGPVMYAEKPISIEYFDTYNLGGRQDFEIGLCLGGGQLLAQKLMKSSSVSEFVKTTKSFLCQFDISIVERNDEWLRKQEMFCILSIAKNSQERPLVLELIYNKSPKLSKPLVLVGKATPYETSFFPLSDKPEYHQYQYRSGMAGASSIVGSLYTLCKLQMPVRVHCIIAVVWNQLHDKPNKIGDVLHAMNGTSIQIDRPEAEGRLVMADILCYADTLDSSVIMDVTTLSSNVDGILGNSYIAFFTHYENLKKLLFKASASCGEKVWQLPLYKSFRALLQIPGNDRISNVGEDARSATACKSAAFLQEFLSKEKAWIHLDVSGVSECRGKKSYLLDWATGRSTRLVAEFCLALFEVMNHET